MLIYQLFPRWFGNRNPRLQPGGSMQENGAGKFNDIDEKALQAIKRLGVSHVWLTGVLEHASATDYSAYGITPVHSALVKGRAGSPYAIRDYYDVCPDLAIDIPHRMQEFEALLARCREEGLQVLIDFVPNHLFREYASDVAPQGVEDFGAQDRPETAFHPQNNFYYLPGSAFRPPVESASDYMEIPARVTGNDCFSPQPSRNDWYETVKLNYGVDYAQDGQPHFQPIPDTWHKMLHILTFWAEKGVDGFRCDMAEMVPEAFWAWVIPQLSEAAARAKRAAPLWIAEIYQPWRYEAYIQSGFDFLYDKMGLYDCLKQVLRGEAPTTQITRCWQALGALQPRMLNFLENHDEQRLASDFFIGEGLKALPALLVSSCLNTAPFMLYAGQEFGERGMEAEGFSGLDGRTSIFDYWSVGSLRRFGNEGRFDGGGLLEDEQKIYALYLRLLGGLRQEAAIARGESYDLMYVNPQYPRQYAFLRYIPNSTVDETLFLLVANFDAQPVEMALHIPPHAFAHGQLQAGAWECREECLQAGATQGLGQRLSPERPFCLSLPAYGAAAFVFSLDKNI
jgi:Glycosidases